ncbi:TFIID-31kDa-domain-containing protein [Coniophora puteana RWD-64-598 SS2]|uniref:TFIID-31kDa-domain-containing protein n=1 Tax=Coniophora puteana (strain RWD-64-598) TaxID=741705 RepID=A0A5M3MSQ5_CONPW|nr:TFIID-31kDa-domain-containing protein [Coniophora puteana RWD-64-598 SS2]EIW82198.1 TFIID-31kDa-domain-containing protein [Coniophora puteana RWD-64-598 SS2]
MSRAQGGNPSADSLPPSARAIALLLASTPTVQDAQPGVLHQLLELAHRYTAQVLSDAQVYAEHAGRSGTGRVEMDDVVLAIQARVGWEFGGRVPKEYILSLASQVNATPLPAVPEIFGVRLPPAGDTLTSVNFDLVPNKPPPSVPQYDEEVEEVEEEDEEEEEEGAEDGIQGEEEEEEEEEEEYDQKPIPAPGFGPPRAQQREEEEEEEDDADMEPAAIPITPSDVEMRAGTGTPGVGAPVVAGGDEEASEHGDGDNEDLFGEEDEGEEGSNADEAMEEVPTQGNGVKRKLVEDEDYD